MYGNNAQNNYAPNYAMAQQQACDATPRPLSAMEQVKDRFNAALNQMAQLCEQLAVIEARLTGGGSAGNDANSKTVQPMPSGHIAQMNVGLDAMFARIDQCAGTASRMSDLI
jgi:hypothetical protein